MSPFLLRRPLVGSLRALTSAEMAALRGIAAARSGFLLAALHSVAERFSHRQAPAPPPSPHPDPLASKRGCTHSRLLREEKSRETRWWWPEPQGPSLEVFPPLGHMPRLLSSEDRSCWQWRRRRALQSSGARMASGERAASGAQLLFGGSFLTSALALPQENAASSSAPAAQRATAKDSELPRGNFRSARALSAPEDCNARLRHRYPAGPSPFASKSRNVPISEPVRHVSDICDLNRGCSPLRLPAPLVHTAIVFT